MAEGVERKLAAILAADVVGYSRLVGKDEEGTLRTLGACREVIDILGRVLGDDHVERAGMQREGVLRQHIVKDGAAHDVVFYGILASDANES